MTDTMQCPNTGDTLVRATGPRPDWKLPEAPLCTHYVFDTTTDEVEKLVPTQPVAYIEDAWCLYWSCPECPEDGAVDGNEIDWPFKPDEFAKPEDLEALGFRVVT